MSQIFTIENDRVVIKKLALEELSGDLTVSGTLTVDNLVVKNSEETEKPVLENFGNWEESHEPDLQTKGFSWTWANGTTHLAYRNGGRIWTSGHIDLEPTKSFMIDGIAVLSKNELGSQITKSKLKEVGSLKDLTVLGNTALGEFAIFNATVNRLGLNTEEPNGTFSVVENNVELVVTSQKENVGHIGTHTNSDLEIISDNTTRITVKNNGQIIFGNPSTNNADVRIYGTLHVETVVADNRIDRYQPLEFRSSKDAGIYGQGLVWTGQGSARRLVMLANPDRIFSSESFDLATDQSYHIGGVSVLSSVGLGKSVTQSNLSKLGTLENLAVEGETVFLGDVNASRSVINAKSILFNDGDEFTITNSKLNGNRKISFSVNNDETYYADLNEIIIGNKQNIRRPVKVFGQMSVGINNPEEGVDLAVKGNIQFSNKKFVTGPSVPTSGNFNKGDICWNENPVADNYVGWICIEAGAPGRWLPFGSIARQ
jgi:hypothetical protein